MPLYYFFQINITIADPADTPSDYGMYTLRLTQDESRESWHTGISVHLLDPSESTYAPTIYDTKDYVADEARGAVQAALDAWEVDIASHSKGGIVLIRPKDYSTANPEAAHIENLIMSRPVKLQGIGPGGDSPLIDETLGSRLSGAGFGAGILCDPEIVPDQLFCDALSKAAWIQRIKAAVAELGESEIVRTV